MNTVQVSPIEPYVGEEDQYERMYKILRQQICIGDLTPGEVLSENALAKKFGVSRTPIRRVLQRLEHEEFVYTKHGVGTIVCPIDIIEIKELYDLRMKLAELYGVLPPIARVSDQDIQLFEEFLQRCQELYGEPQPRKLALLNFDMHIVQLRHIGNRALRQIFDQLYYRSCRLWLQLLPEMDWNEEVRGLQRELDDTLAAMRNQDIATIGLIRRNSISLCVGRIKKYIGGASELDTSGGARSINETQTETETQTQIPSPRPVTS
jgi:DNA-binding GntR family transcriptional regulator